MIPRGVIVDAFIKTPEAQDVQIVADYQKFFNRTPDQSEINIWVNQPDRKRQMIASDEFFFRSGNTPESFVTGMYTALLGRQPGSDELQSWIDALHGGPAEPIDNTITGAVAKNTANMAKPQMAYALAGDSITDWFQTNGAQVWNESYATLPANDFGISGLGTQHVLWQAEQGQFKGVKALQLLIGTNDLGSYHRTPDQVIATTENIIAHLDPTTKVLLVGILPRGLANDPLRSLIAEANRGLLKLASPRVSFIDLTPNFLQTNGEFKPNLMYPDKVHPFLAGYALIRALTYPIFVGMGQV